jgi:hypothetical protein
MEPRRSVIEDQLKNGLGTAGKPLESLGYDFTPGENRLANIQAVNGRELSAVFVTGRTVEQEVLHRPDFQTGQLSRAFRADPVQGSDRLRQG